jgi:arylsulfatase A-like enzyme
VVCTVQNDQLKVTGIINEIHGLTHDGKPGPGVPEVFGMNFQAVSVGEKLATDNYDASCVSDTGSLNGQPGGYLDGSGTPSAVLQYALDQTDAALLSMIQALKDQNLYESTLFIVTSKHGQSPINPVKTNKPGHFADLVAALPDGGTNTAAKAIVSAGACASGPCGFVNDDDIGLVWLADQTLDQAARDYVNTNALPLFVDEVLGGDELTLRFNDPLKDSRTPDLIIRPNYGTIYTTSTAKNAEHGGFNYSDTNVGLIVSLPSLAARTIKSPVATSQVAPTILRVLGIDPQNLKSVRVERTKVLPGLGIDGAEQ